MADWQPIETAPKDGTQVIFYGKWRPYDILEGGGDCMIMAVWSSVMSDGTGFHWMSGLSSVDTYNVDFTHWMPLPAPPHEPETGPPGKGA